jgi:hypothetical protein
MNKAKRYLCGFAVLTGLFLIGSLMRSPESQAKGAYSSPVTVLNTSSAPAITSTIDDPGRIAYQAQQALSPSGNTFSLTFTFGAVPANHRLVVQHISGFLNSGSNSPAALVSIATPSSSPLSAFFTQTLGGSSFFNESLFDQLVLVYFDAGQQPTVTAFGPTFVANNSQIVNLTGYMLDCSAAACAAIAH